MEVETILNLFDSYWFDLDFLTRKPFQNTKNFPEMPPTSSEIIPASLPTIHTRKNPVEKTLSSSNSSNNSPANRFDSSFSPNSVLLTPKLQTIFSGKVSEDIEDESKSSEKQKTPEIITTITTTAAASKNMITSSSSPLKGNTGITHNKRRKKKGLSKSLSDLEFEELKGFMDLGFVFSEEDMKDSSLATIIPGLQRLGNKNNTNIDDNNCNGSTNNKSNVDENKEKVEKLVEKCGEIARPYLSEAWEVMERKRRENELMLKSRVPDPHSQVQMKDYLRSWAHSVASTVR